MFKERAQRRHHHSCKAFSQNSFLIGKHLMNKLDKEIGAVSISLYDIATGPSHQDFVLKMKKV